MNTRNPTYDYSIHISRTVLLHTCSCNFVYTLSLSLSISIFLLNMSICHLYFICSKISPNRLTPVKVSLEESLNGLDEAVVVFVKEDTKGLLKQHTYIVLFDMIINNNELLIV